MWVGRMMVVMMPMPFASNLIMPASLHATGCMTRAGGTVMMVMVIMIMIMMVVVVPDALDMMVMTHLGLPDLILETENLFAILAEAAVHGRVAVKNLPGAFDERFNDQWMIIQVGSLHELDFGVTLRRPVRGFVDAFDEDAREQEVGEHDDAAKTQPGGLVQSRSDKRESDAGIGGFGPAEAESLQ